MIKSDHSSSPSSTPHPACFVERDSPLGIAFEATANNKGFVPYSHLTAVDYIGTDELVFRYTFCKIIVRGQALDPIWNALCAGSLSKIIATSKPNLVHDETMVQSITVIDSDSAPENSGGHISLSAQSRGG